MGQAARASDGAYVPLSFAPGEVAAQQDNFVAPVELVTGVPGCLQRFHSVFVGNDLKFVAEGTPPSPNWNSGLKICLARPVFVMSACPVTLGAAWANNGIASVPAAAVAIVRNCRRLFDW
jgi:hypothetical protein